MRIILEIDSVEEFKALLGTSVETIHKVEITVAGNEDPDAAALKVVNLLKNHRKIVPLFEK